MNKLHTTNHQETAKTPWPALLGHFEEVKVNVQIWNKFTHDFIPQIPKKKI
jgi:hypothetical protein